jgi:hypothetical protein
MSARRAGGLTHARIVRFGEEQYACKVTDMSATGAVLTFRGPAELPERFTLMLTPATWEEGDQIGVVFGDASLPEA